MDQFWQQLQARASDLAPVLAGVLGRLLFHAELVRRGRRPPVGILLFCELLIAIPMGFVGQAAADWFGLQGNVAFGGAIVVAYLGPRLLDLAFGHWLAGQSGAR